MKLLNYSDWFKSKRLIFRNQDSRDREWFLNKSYFKIVFKGKSDYRFQTNCIWMNILFWIRKCKNVNCAIKIIIINYSKINNIYIIRWCHHLYYVRVTHEHVLTLKYIFLWMIKPLRYYGTIHAMQQL